ncbi:MAG: ABC transporter permease, partial [Candidatus Bipolaricaulota bacterium]
MFLTLLKREVFRYIKNPTVTIGPPIVSQILYVLVFGLVLGVRIGMVAGHSYISFMFPGLVMMALITNSFMNPGWSLYMARHFNWIEPILSSPMSSTQIVSAYIFAGVIRGILVSTLLISLALLIPNVVALTHIPVVIVYLVLVSFLGSSLGTLVGLWADKFDHMALAQTFGLFPLVFLGGVFYSLEMLEGLAVLEVLVKVNPVTHMINGLRYGMIGVSELNLTIGLAGLLSLAAILFLLCVNLFRRGYHLRV